MGNKMKKSVQVIEGCPHDVVDFNGKVIVTMNNRKLAQIVANHYAWNEPQPQVRLSPAS